MQTQISNPTKINKMRIGDKILVEPPEIAK